MAERINVHHYERDENFHNLIGYLLALAFVTILVTYFLMDILNLGLSIKNSYILGFIISVIIIVLIKFRRRIFKRK